VYDAHADSRSAMLDGPWWLALMAVGVVSVLFFVSGQWRLLMVPVRGRPLPRHTPAASQAGPEPVAFSLRGGLLV